MSEENGNGQRRRTDNWHFEKRLSLDTIVAILGVALVIGTPFWLWGRSMEDNAAITRQRVAILEKLYENDVKDGKESRSAMLTKMDAFNNEISRLNVEMARLSTSIDLQVKRK